MSLPPTASRAWPQTPSPPMIASNQSAYFAAATEAFLPPFEQPEK